MEDRSTYEEQELLFVGRKAQTFRAFDRVGQRSVILKKLQLDQEIPHGINRLRNEYTIIKSLDLPTIRRALAFERIDGRTTLVLEDVAGVPLRDIMRRGALSIKELLPLFIQLAQAIGDLHDRHVIHKDINPDNILVNITQKKVWLIDFDLACVIPREIAKPLPPGDLAGSLPYISPEQTGRIAQSLDHRTDFYSLGMTFYEAIAGRLPFIQTDSTELVYAHLALIPDSPRVFNPLIPEALARIVLKLIEKPPEMRYGSAFGLIADLERCRLQIEDGMSDFTFPLGEQDLMIRFVFPDRIVGRQAERLALGSALDRVVPGGSELAFLSGDAGIGKSSLIRDLGGSLLRTGAVYLEGKFDQYRRDVPYDALAAALDQYIRRVATWSDLERGRLLNRLELELGAMLVQFAGLVPELAGWLGLSSSAADQRLLADPRSAPIFMRRLLQIFALESGLLVLFLDDLQWADIDSLEVLRDVLLHPDTQSLLIIAAHRTLDARSGQILVSWKSELAARQAALTEISMGPLLTSDVEELLTLCFSRLHGDRSSLAAILQQKTRGNPFFIRQLIEALYREGIVRAEGNAWTFDEEKLHAAKISENVVALLIDRLKKLPEATRQVLQIASCLGNSFTLAELLTVIGTSLEALKSHVDHLVAAEFLMPSDIGYHGWFDAESGVETETRVLRFVHDRVQEAAHETIGADVLSQLHWRIAQALDRGLRDTDGKAFALIRHFNGAEPLILDAQKRLDLARWNLRIARRAREAGSYQTSSHLCAMGIRFAGEEAWSEHEDLMRDLSILAGENSHLSRDYERAEHLFNEAVRRSRTILAKARVQEAQCQLFNLTRQYQSALRVGCEILENLGWPLRKRVHTFSYHYQRLKGIRLLIKHETRLLSLPPITDPTIEMVQRVLLLLNVSAYFESPRLVAWISTLQLQLAVDYGMHPGVAVALHSMAGYLHFSFAPVKARMAAECGLQILHEQSGSASEPRSYLAWGNYVGHWHRPIDEVQNTFAKGFRIAMSSGTIDDAVSFSTSQSMMGFLVGRNLQLSHEELKKAINLLPDNENDWETTLQNYFELLLSPDFRLDQWPLGAVSADEQGQDLTVRLKNGTHLFLYWHVRSVLAYLKGDCDEAYTSFMQSSQYVGRVGSLPGLWSFFTFWVLIGVQKLPRLSFWKQRVAYLKLFLVIRFMRYLARNCPENFQHQYDLMRAEFNRIRKKDAGLVIHQYRSSIAQARRFEFNSHEAIAAERLASLYEELGDPLAAQQSFLLARRAYERWGIVAKVGSIDQRYPDLARLVDRTQTLPGSGSTSGRGLSSAAFDVPLLIKATQALSAEIRESALLERLMRLVVEHAGARYALFLLVDDETKILTIKARIRVGDAVEVTLASKEPEPSDMPLGLMQRTLRTGEVTVIEHAADEGLGLREPYFVSHNCRSVLCMPVSYKSQLYGVLYLENELIAGAFREERVTLLNVLCGQMTVSLENSRLYRDVAVSLDAERAARAAQQEALVAEKKARSREQEAHDEWVRSEGARRELASSIEAARAVQEALLETGGEVPGCELAWFYRPAERAGGDWFGNYYVAAHSRLYMCVADVTGHGIPSALVTAAIAGATASAISALRMQPIGAMNDDLHAIARAVNEAVLHTGARANRSATMVLLALDTQSGEGAILYAAHPLAYIRRASTVATLMGRGNLLGLKVDPSFETRRFSLLPGDVIFLYSDGLIENADSKGRMLRSRSLMKIIEDTDDPLQIVDQLRVRVEAFVQNKATDDTTFVVLKWQGTATQLPQVV